jgi:hypothetical protein
MKNHAACCQISVIPKPQLVGPAAARFHATMEKHVMMINASLTCAKQMMIALISRTTAFLANAQEEHALQLMAVQELITAPPMASASLVMRTVHKKDSTVTQVFAL